ncbi:MAG TPA: hypothetical protein VEY07_00570, partial [Thermoplasmata archaeon]|nr:hypothetical protein [Thermoplasmata archaeon]
AFALRRGASHAGAPGDSRLIPAVGAISERPHAPHKPGNGPTGPLLGDRSTSSQEELLRFLSELASTLSPSLPLRVISTESPLDPPPQLAWWQSRHPRWEIVLTGGIDTWRRVALGLVRRVGLGSTPRNRFRGRAEVTGALVKSIEAMVAGSEEREWIAPRSEAEAGSAAYQLRSDLAATGRRVSHPRGAAEAGSPSPVDPERLRASARFVLRRYLRVRRGERVTIEAWTSTLEYGNAFVLESLRLGARPLLLYQDEPTYWAATTEVPARSLAALGDHRRAALEKTDVFVSFLGPSDRERVHSLPSRVLFRLGEYQDALYRAVSRSHARAVQMAVGRVSSASARMYGVDESAWRDELVEGTLVDPLLLRSRGRRLAKALRNGRELEIAHANGTRLRLRLRGRLPVLTDGLVRSAAPRGGWHLITLPAGIVSVAVDERSADGTFVSNLSSSVGLSDSVGEFDGGRWTFRSGRLARYQYEKGHTLFDQSYRRAGPGRDLPGMISIGLNDRISRSPLLEDQGLGTVTLNIGRNSFVGGANNASWWAWLYLRGGTVRVDGRPIVRDGRLIGD